VNGEKVDDFKFSWDEERSLATAIASKKRSLIKTTRTKPKTNTEKDLY
jgi:hypothetical protein